MAEESVAGQMHDAETVNCVNVLLRPLGCSGAALGVFGGDGGVGALVADDTRCLRGFSALVEGQFWELSGELQALQAQSAGGAQRELGPGFLIPTKILEQILFYRLLAWVEQAGTVAHAQQ